MAKKETEFATIRVRAFDRKSEFIAMELHIAPVPLVELRRLAGLPDRIDFPVGGIDLKPHHLPKIRQWIDDVLDTTRFDVMFSEGALPHDYVEE